MGHAGRFDIIRRAPFRAHDRRRSGIAAVSVSSAVSAWKVVQPRRE